MAIVPAGTGNMLARSLGIPLALEPAVRRAFIGQGRVIELCRAELTYPGGCTEQPGFAAMAGVGVDAGNSVRVSITLDDAPPVCTDLRTCIALAIVRGCHIEPGCLIGMNATVLSKSRVGTGSIVGGGAVVLEG